MVVGLEFVVGTTLLFFVAPADGVSPVLLFAGVFLALASVALDTLVHKQLTIDNTVPCPELATDPTSYEQPPRMSAPFGLPVTPQKIAKLSTTKSKMRTSQNFSAPNMSVLNDDSSKPPVRKPRKNSTFHTIGEARAVSQVLLLLCDWCSALESLLCGCN